MEAADQEQASLAIHWQPPVATACSLLGPVQVDGSLPTTPVKLHVLDRVFSSTAQDSRVLPQLPDLTSRAASPARLVPPDRWDSLFPDQTRPFRMQWRHVKELLRADGLAISTDGLAESTREDKALVQRMDDWLAALDNRIYEHHGQLESYLANERDCRAPDLREGLAALDNRIDEHQRAAMQSQCDAVEELSAAAERQRVQSETQRDVRHTQCGTVGELKVSVQKVWADLETQRSALQSQSSAVQELTAAVERQRVDLEERFLVDKAEREGHQTDAAVLQSFAEDGLQKIPDKVASADFEDLADTVDRHRTQVEEQLAGARATHCGIRADLNAVRDLVEARLLREVAALRQAVEDGPLPEVLQYWQASIEAQVGGERAAADEARRRHVSQVKAELEGRLAEASEAQGAETRALRADFVEMKAEFKTLSTADGPGVDTPGRADFESLRVAIEKIKADVALHLAGVRAEVAESVAELARCNTRNRAREDDVERADHAQLHDQLRLELEALREGLESSATHNHTLESDNTECLRVEIADLSNSHQQLRLEVNATQARLNQTILSCHRELVDLQEEVSTQRESHENVIGSLRIAVEEQSYCLQESHESGFAVFRASAEERNAEVRCSMCELQDTIRQVQATAVAERASIAELRPALEVELREVLEFCFTELRGTLEGQLAGVEERFRVLVSSMSQAQQSAARASICEVDDRLRAELARLWKAQESKGFMKITDRPLRAPSVCSDTTCGGNISPRDHQADAPQSPEGLRSAPFPSRSSGKSCLGASCSPKGVAVRRTISAPGPYAVSRILSPQLSRQISSVSPCLDISPRLSLQPVWPPPSPSAAAF